MYERIASTLKEKNEASKKTTEIVDAIDRL